MRRGKEGGFSHYPPGVGVGRGFLWFPGRKPLELVLAILVVCKSERVHPHVVGSQVFVLSGVEKKVVSRRAGDPDVLKARWRFLIKM